MNIENVIYKFWTRNYDYIVSVIYTIAFIVTYGHAYNAHFLLASKSGALDPMGSAMITSLVSSLFWPLYISVQLWK